MDMVTLVASSPFLMHILTACANFVGIQFLSASRDSVEWWLESFLACYSLGPRSGDLHLVFAGIQLIAGVAALGLHFGPGGLAWRKASYYILIGLCVVTLVRHLLWSSSAVLFGYLYTNIALFAILVLYHDSFLKWPHVTKSE
ncbi:hypothetical protein MAR_022219 [Mya arenaria]|uniref:Uncharacterized protein n=1 Tax=Mya arenaria TaxID=6604 RepID=A0ABY7DJH2_MYAAR|nr:hypothetical protein MAR_022219 [Mya arenaria]